MRPALAVILHHTCSDQIKSGEIKLYQKLEVSRNPVYL